MRESLLTEIKCHYNTKRLKSLVPEFLAFEEDMAKLDDLILILEHLKNKSLLKNPNNSCLLYVTCLTNEFDFNKARCVTVGGTPPDADIDFEALRRDMVLDLVIKKWGRDNVANIITHGTLQPRGATRSYFRVTAPDDEEALLQHNKELSKVLEQIPPPLFGKEPSLNEIIQGNPEKGYLPNPALSKDYPEWYSFVSNLEDMVTTFGIHASGVIISENPIYTVLPTWSNKKSERITQFDMKECEELGLIKYDFLGINNLDIIAECIRLIQQRHGILYDIYKIDDGDVKAYKILAAGLLSGIFQFETSKSAKDLILKSQPTSISELAVLSALDGGH